MYILSLIVISIIITIICFLLIWGYLIERHIKTKEIEYKRLEDLVGMHGVVVSINSNQIIYEGSLKIIEDSVKPDEVFYYLSTSKVAINDTVKVVSTLTDKLVVMKIA